jgi:hypothetical protein
VRRPAATIPSPRHYLLRGNSNSPS